MNKGLKGKNQEIIKEKNYFKTIKLKYIPKVKEDENFNKEIKMLTLDVLTFLN